MPIVIASLVFISLLGSEEPRAKAHVPTNRDSCLYAIHIINGEFAEQFEMDPDSVFEEDTGPRKECEALASLHVAYSRVNTGDACKMIQNGSCD